MELRSLWMRVARAACVALGLLAAAAYGARVPHAQKARQKHPGELTLLFVGGSAGDGSTPTLQRLETRLESLEPERAVVVFTGNYAASELPVEGSPQRAQAERAVLAHVEATADFVRRGGQVFFLAGQRDFGQGGTRAVRRLSAFLNAAYRARGAPEDAVDVMPRAGCGDPTLLELSSDVGLLLLDSQWWMQDQASDPAANEGCEVATRGELAPLVLDALRSYRGRRLVIASHHPLRSYGDFSGALTAGSAWSLAHAAGLVPQYQDHPTVRAYADLLLEQAQLNGSYVFASGHDASLQVVQVEQQLQLVSGTSARAASPAATARAGDFAAASPGWVELFIAPTGTGEVKLFSGDADEAVLFEAALPELPAPERALPPPNAMPLSPQLARYAKYDVWELGPVLKRITGAFYTSAYQLRLPYEVLDLSQEQGGLKARGIGGGLQTKSIKFRDAQGAEWVARSVTKDSSRVLPWPQNQATLVNRLLDYGFTGQHPEGALVVPRLAEALGVLHTTPRLLYLPDQEGLGRYRGHLGDEVVLFERHPKAAKEGMLPVELSGAPGADGSIAFTSTPELLEKLMEDPGVERVDAEAMLRARLLDMLVGDWDRHQGQWAFAGATDLAGVRTWRPIPRDRDQALASYDGLGLAIARVLAPGVRVTHPFNARYGNLEWLNYSARFIDPVLLNRLPRARWVEIATAAKAALTDAVIDEAMASWHAEAYALDGARVAAALKSRRDTLVEAAAGYYEVLSRDVDVVGSRGDDLFELWFNPDGSVRVVVRPKAGAGSDAPPPYFERVFEPAETDDLRLYALEGDDVLWVHGDAPTSMTVRFIGGPGADAVAAAPPARATLEARALRVYDAPDGLEVAPSLKARDERSDVAALNHYDVFENHDPDTFAFMPSAQVNADDGLYAGASLLVTTQGYKKHPFASQHYVSGAVASATGGVNLAYRGFFPDVVDQLDQELDVLAQSPNYARNFFGLTNQRVPDVLAPDYFRVRQAQVELRYGLSYAFGALQNPMPLQLQAQGAALPNAVGGVRSRFGVQLFGQAFVTEATPGRFVTASPEVKYDDLGARYFAGAKVFVETNTFDDLNLPTRGIALHLGAEGRGDVARGGPFSITYRAAGAFAIPLERARRVVLLSRLSVVGIVGEHPFYFAPSLGGSDLRAYHPYQLAGDVAFSQSTDLRIDVLRIRSVLPGTAGVHLSFDHGRVFGTSRASDAYHADLGGGVWWSFMDLIGASFSYFRGFDGADRLVFSVGPLFAQTGF
jgi:hypothetical protein